MPRRVGLLRRAYLLEAALPVPRDRPGVKAAPRLSRQGVQRHQRGLGPPGAVGTGQSRQLHQGPGPTARGPGLHGGLTQLLPAQQVLARHSGQGVLPGGQLQQPVLRAGL